MEEDRCGLTPEEREYLTARPKNENEMGLKMSLLAFAGLLLICALIVAASLIARSQRDGAASSIAPPPSRGTLQNDLRFGKTSPHRDEEATRVPESSTQLTTAADAPGALEP